MRAIDIKSGLTKKVINDTPCCTQKALEDHLGELASAKDGQFVVSIEYIQPLSDDVETMYNAFRTEVQDDYSNVMIKFPWDKEVQ